MTKDDLASHLRLTHQLFPAVGVTRDNMSTGVTMLYIFLLVNADDDHVDVLCVG